MIMFSCRNHHEEIWYECIDCPLCELIEEHDILTQKLAADIEKLKSELGDVKNG